MADAMGIATIAQRIMVTAMDVGTMDMDINTDVSSAAMAVHTVSVTEIKGGI